VFLTSSYEFPSLHVLLPGLQTIDFIACLFPDLAHILAQGPMLHSPAHISACILVNDKVWDELVHEQ
jgi:hypothetical protein